MFQTALYRKNIHQYLLILLITVTACLKQDEWTVPDTNCSSDVLPNFTLRELLESYSGTTAEIIDNWIIEAYVISSDRSGNIFNALHLQDKPSNPTAGIQLEVELRDSYLIFQQGDRVLLYLKGLYMGKSKGVFKLGSAYTSFGNLQPGRIPRHAISNHIVQSCDASISLIPKIISISEIHTQPVNTLVRLEEMEFTEEELDSSYAQKQLQTIRKLLDCTDNEILLINSGYSDFYQEPLPEGKGSITAITYLIDDEPGLIIRSLDDVKFTDKRCEDYVTEFTSDQIYISELADPDNNNSARFLELYYSGNKPLSLKGWHIDRYTNNNVEVSSSIDLSDYVINPGQIIVIASNAEAFEQTYGFPPDMAAGVNSPADSNGDDNLTLVDPFGEVIDIFGVIGEDGSGTSHEFEDGRAFRRNEVSLANPFFTPSEWIIYNDTGASGTINQPQNAPQDFTPGFPN
ncbi:MAG: lamin tail domain-containing protein [Flavobacteriaceae bacterium]|nr:lamin tail domain-containing protein [Flavobacteriaceae bacterium]